MASPVWCCGGECGVDATGVATGTHWYGSTTGFSFSTTTVRSGDRALRFNPSAAGCRRSHPALASSFRWVGRAYVQFATLPTVSTSILSAQGSNFGAGIYFNTTDSKLYARVDSTAGSTGVAITTGVWYRLDWDFLAASGGATNTTQLQVDGVACGAASIAANNAATTFLVLGNVTNTTMDMFVDDYLVSQTAADYPLGAGSVNHFVPTSDGTHNIAGTGDFLRTLTGTDILNATTTAYQLVDDVPLESGASVDWINMAAPTAATQYVECLFGPAPGISTPTTPPRAVEVLAAIHQSAAGTTGNMEIRLNDNGTMGTVYTATAVAGVATIVYKRAHFADPPSAATAWVIGGAGNGDFTDLKVQFGSPAVVDVAPDQYFDCIMIEAEFADVVAGPATSLPLPVKRPQFYPQRKVI